MSDLDTAGVRAAAIREAADALTNMRVRQSAKDVLWDARQAILALLAKQPDLLDPPAPAEATPADDEEVPGEWRDSEDDMEITLLIEGERRGAVTIWSHAKTGDFAWCWGVVVANGQDAELGGTYDTVGEAQRAVYAAATAAPEALPDHLSPWGKRQLFGGGP